MLTVKYVEDEDTLFALYDKIGYKGKITSGINAVLYEEDESVGFCRMVLTENGLEIVEFQLSKDAWEEPGVPDFLLRTVLFKLSKSEVLVRIKANDKRLEVFGFRRSGEYMEVKAPDIVFPTCPADIKR